MPIHGKYSKKLLSSRQRSGGGGRSGSSSTLVLVVVKKRKYYLSNMECRQVGWTLRLTTFESGKEGDINNDK